LLSCVSLLAQESASVSKVKIAEIKNFNFIQGKFDIPLVMTNKVCNIYFSIPEIVNGTKVP